MYIETGHAGELSLSSKTVGSYKIENSKFAWSALGRTSSGANLAVIGVLALDSEPQESLLFIDRSE